MLKSLLNKLKELLILLRSLLIKPSHKKDYIAFREALGQRESGGDYRAVNPYGYLGKYQFGMARLCDLGYTERKPGTTGYSNANFIWKNGYSKEWFLTSPKQQDEIFYKHCQLLKKRIVEEFNDYLGVVTVLGISITLSGLIAGAHLGGIGGIRNFVLHGADSLDANGTRISQYIKEFGDYDI